MWRRAFCVNWAVLLILVLTAAAHGQSTARLFGIILDPEGARVPAASIKMTNEATGEEHTTLSDSEGHYQIAALPAATYRIDVYAVGFKNQILENMSVDVGRTLVQDFRMEVATVSEAVTV